MSNEQSAPATHDGNDAVPHTVSAFDIRTIVGALIGFYGVVLIIVGLFADSTKELSKTGGVHANLWAGIVMAVFATVLLVWSRLRPVIVE
ncbi:hypothetical protein ACWF0M_12300 [Kribbella sp. NPDC055110]